MCSYPGPVYHPREARYKPWCPPGLRLMAKFVNVFEAILQAAGFTRHIYTDVPIRQSG